MKKIFGATENEGTILMRAMLSLLIVFLWYSSISAEDKQPLTVAGVPKEEALRLGERMYREGILPSGETMQAIVKGDIPVPGTAFSCMSCHLRSGLGCLEGRVVTPPTNGKRLLQPFRITHYKRYYKKDPQIISSRSAYIDESLAEAIRGGIDPSGRTLDEVMPRYLLEDRDMAVLISYLKALSSDFSPGVTGAALRFATVVSEDVSPEVRDAMVVPLVNGVNSRNTSPIDWKVQESMNRYIAESAIAPMQFSSPETTYRTLSLSVWVLKGPPETWRGQLEEYYRKEPVFALLGGIATGDWKPIHDFCEANHLPNLFPLTDFPVISETDWYTLYFSKGYYQEGEGAARYLNTMDELTEGSMILQIVRDSREGRALAAGFQNTWREMEHRAPVSVMLKAEETLTAEFLREVLAREKPAVVVLWDGPQALTALETLASSDKNRPRMVFVSSGYLGRDVWIVKEEARDFTYITYPFRLPKDEARSMGQILLLMGKAKVGEEAQRVAKQTYSIIQVLNRALMDMNGNYYRDYFFDVIGMMEDQRVPLYERLSFGLGQHYASKGCYIVQLSKGPKPELVKKSDWIIH